MKYSYIINLLILTIKLLVLVDLVKNPIQINFKDNMTVKDLIFAAGGPVLSKQCKGL